MSNLISVIWIEQQYVGGVLATLAVAVLLLLLAAVNMHDARGEMPHPALLRLAGMLAVPLVTLGLSAL